MTPHAGGSGGDRADSNIDHCPRPQPSQPSRDNPNYSGGADSFPLLSGVTEPARPRELPNRFVPPQRAEAISLWSCLTRRGFGVVRFGDQFQRGTARPFNTAARGIGLKKSNNLNCSVLQSWPQTRF